MSEKTKNIEHTGSSGKSITYEMAELMINELEKLIKGYKDMNEFIKVQTNQKLTMLLNNLETDEGFSMLESDETYQHINRALSLAEVSRDKMTDLFIDLSEYYASWCRSNRNTINPSADLRAAKDILEGRIE